VSGRPQREGAEGPGEAPSAAGLLGSGGTAGASATGRVFLLGSGGTGGPRPFDCKTPVVRSKGVGGRGGGPLDTVFIVSRSFRRGAGGGGGRSAAEGAGGVALRLVPLPGTGRGGRGRSFRVRWEGEAWRHMLRTTTSPLARWTGNDREGWRAQRKSRSVPPPPGLGRHTSRPRDPDARAVVGPRFPRDFLQPRHHHAHNRVCGAFPPPSVGGYP